MHDTEMPSDPTRRNQCRHIHTRGTRCGSPALRGHQFCFYHDRSRREAPDAHGYHGSFKMPRIDDRDAVQLALFEVLSRIAAHDIDYRQARLLLSGLRIAATNLPRPVAHTATDQPDVHEVVFDPLLQEDLAPIAEFREQPAAIQPQTSPAPPSEEPAPNPVPHSIAPIRIPAEDWVDSPAMRYVASPLAAIHATAVPPQPELTTSPSSIYVKRAFHAHRLSRAPKGTPQTAPWKSRSFAPTHRDSSKPLNALTHNQRTPTWQRS